MEWRPIETAPYLDWIKTKREGESGENVCFRRKWPWGEEEWVEYGSGRTTITHSTFAPPTHWMPLPEPPKP